MTGVIIDDFLGDSESAAELDRCRWFVGIE
jgi:hypothetical protein